MPRTRKAITCALDDYRVGVEAARDFAINRAIRNFGKGVAHSKHMPCWRLRITFFSWTEYFSPSTISVLALLAIVRSSAPIQGRNPAWNDS
jgi:hypothetical protein